MGKVCTFFGHRTILRTPFCVQRTREVMIDLIENHDVDVFILGDHGQYDNLCFSIARDLKKQYPHICLHLYLPYIEKHGENRINEGYDSIEITDIGSRCPYRYKFPRRNEIMVARCDFFVCYIKWSWGGAFNALKIAMRKKKHIINIAREEGVCTFNEDGSLKDDI